MNKRKMFRALLTLLVASGVLVACSQPTGSDGGGSGSGDQPGTGTDSPAPVTVQELGAWDDDGNIDDIEEIAAEGDALFAIDQSFAHNLYGVDMGNPTAPKMGSAVSTADYLFDYALSGDYLYVSDSGSELLIYDVSTPTSPTLEGSCDYSAEGSGSTRIVVDGDYAYLTFTSTTAPNGTLAIDISDKTAPSFADSIINSGSFTSADYEIVVIGNVAYYDGSGEIVALDISDPN